MLPKQYRLTRPVPYQQSKTVSAPLFSIRYQQKTAHIGVQIVVSKRVSSKAVDRNRLKRIIAASMIPLVPQLQEGVAMTIFVKKEAQDRTQELQQLLKDTLRNEGLLQ